MENITVQKLEKLLEMTPEELGKMIGIQRAGTYKIRKKYPEKYKILLLGVRLYKSPLKTKDILELLTPIERIVESFKG